MGGICEKDRMDLFKLKQQHTIIFYVKEEKKYIISTIPYSEITKSGTDDIKDDDIMNHVDDYSMVVDDESVYMDFNDTSMIAFTHSNIHLTLWFDAIASFLTPIFQFENTPNNMRYDVQIAPFFRASIFCTFLLGLGAIFLALSITLHVFDTICAYFTVKNAVQIDLHHDDDCIMENSHTFHHVSHDNDDGKKERILQQMVHFLNSLGSLFVLSCHLVYLGMTGWYVFFLRNCKYALGSVLALVISFCIFVLDANRNKIY